jgi:predicted NBD/HSP70 family sugar kinase
MREHNLALLLQGIATHQPVSRAGLAAATGLTRTAVSNLVAVLIEAGLVREGAVLHEGERGRPGVAVTLDENGAASLGLEVNVDYLAACVLDLGRRVRYRRFVETDNRHRSPDDILRALGSLAATAVADAAAHGLAVVGSMVALPGVLDRTGLLDSPNLGWAGVPIRVRLQWHIPALRLGTGVDNDANLAALGELRFGAGPGLGDFLHVSGEIGVGAGLVVDGELYRGAHGRAGELGHLCVDPQGPPCTCGGRGCLERAVGQEAILRAGLGPGDGPALVDALVARLDGEDATALRAVRDAGCVLGGALATAAKLFDVDAVVLGGLFARLAPWLAPAVEESLRAQVHLGAAPRVVVSALGRDAAVLGAAGVALDRVFADPARLLPRPSAGRPPARATPPAPPGLDRGHQAL